MFTPLNALQSQLYHRLHNTKYIDALSNCQIKYIQPMLAAARTGTRHLHHLRHANGQNEAPRDPDTWMIAYEDHARDCMHGYEFVELLV